jgi:hypothetical protein
MDLMVVRDSLTHADLFGALALLGAPMHFGLYGPAGHLGRS